ncbi:(Trans)glycosidase [Glarea lozoyensis ATCC 20868]|uniref:Probable beta-glucosidase G n=1 Tax=Glarea lozoyensis (strain ATCC 20868 / MF5171) TaxID=1116229 RepID=S3D5N1_GLAL2|nr:(Trans)glycosidase [Glarea lozoyensis ATCC 20868]EPE27396.1 (Trans)glycosidase [Glarea lozoyensis ATCC 20868]
MYILSGLPFLLATTQLLSVVTCQDEVSSRSKNTPDYISDNALLQATQKANDFIAKLTLEQKAKMVTGNSSAGGGCIGTLEAFPDLGFGGLCSMDGPTALNRADLMSVFPAGLTAAASWDRDLIYERGNSLGNEFRDKGVHVLLGPSAGPLGRHPLGGRNWEGFSPDPYLTGVAMDRTIRGIQDAGVQSVSKHFIANEQENHRSNTFLRNRTEIEAISSNVDDRTMHELYLWPFYDAVKAGTVSVMCAYNRVNQTYACQNDAALNGLLKGELGFRGYVSSDYFAVHAGVSSAAGGLDLNMPGSYDLASIYTGSSYFGGNITLAVNNGSLPLARVDDMVRRIMMPYYLLGQDKDYPTIDPGTLGVLANLYNSYIEVQPMSRDVRRNHAKTIRLLGSAGSVLLKNEKNILPIDTKKIKNIGVFGNDAGDLTAGLTFPGELVATSPEFGTLDVGGGSGTGRHTYIVSPLDAIKARAQRTGARVQYILDNNVLARNDFNSIYPNPDVCFVFLKTYASEGFDRRNWEADWNSTFVVKNVALRCPNTVVITHSAGINTMPWANNPNVTAIIAAHLPGEQTGNSIVDILWGDFNPSGKLPYTIPKNESDYDIPTVNLTNVSTTTEWQSNFTEGQMIDYRHFDANNIEPLYEFGFGLSYTTFELSSNMKLTTLLKNPSAEPNPGLGIKQGGNPDLWTDVVRVVGEVKNTGQCSGATVVQLYVGLPDSVPVGKVVRALRGFEKVFLKPNEKRRVEFLLKRRDLSYWDVVSQRWLIPTGQFEVQLGFSSRDFKAKATLQLR